MGERSRRSYERLYKAGAEGCQLLQETADREVYEAIRAPYCLWPTPSWVWHNLGPGGYDTGIYQTVVVRGWISAMHCVKRHYLMIEGTQVISLDGD
jgi:hypothetical protein